MTKNEFFALGGTQENFSDPNFNVVEFVESLEGINDFIIQKEIEQEYWTLFSKGIIDYVLELDSNHSDYYKVFEIDIFGGVYSISKSVLDHIFKSLEIVKSDIHYSVWHCDLAISDIHTYQRTRKINKGISEYLETKSIVFSACRISETIKFPYSKFDF
jgi:chromosome condensin MukBEF ATPase and DNA-binding subunit MukB